MRVFVTKQVHKWAGQEGVPDATLVAAAQNAIRGRHDADLGGHLFKARIAREGQGKSGGFRTILCFLRHDSERIFFLHGFAKNEKADISPREGKALKLVARSLLSLDDRQLAQLLTLGTLIELDGRLP